jgi:putative glycosyltransferase (TIGR04372 family)
MLSIISSETRPKGNLSNYLLMIDRVIDWHALASPLLYLHRQGDKSIEPMDTLLRLIVLRELANSDENTAECRKFLNLERNESLPSEHKINQFLSRLSELDKFDELKSNIRQQILPWQTWLTKTYEYSVSSQTASKLLAEETSSPLTFLRQKLKPRVVQHAGKTGLPNTKVFNLTLPLRLLPIVDNIAEIGLLVASNTGHWIKKYRLHRFLLGNGQKGLEIRRRGRGRFLELLLPLFDGLLSACLRNLSRSIPDEALLGSSRLKTASIASRLYRVSPILFIRGRLFLAEGDYQRAYYFFLASIAWGSEKDSLLFHAATAAQFSGEFVKAEELYRVAMLCGEKNAYLLRNLGLVLLTLGKEQEASFYLAWSARLSYGFFMAHQNLAGMYDTLNFVPRAYDRAGYSQILLYDAYNLAGERLVHLGEGIRGLQCYAAALRKQEELESTIRLPDEIRKILKDEYEIPINESVRILPYEWVTLIGHIAMLDSYIKLQKLGIGKPGRVLLLAPTNKVANHTYLNLWRPYITVINDPYLINDLFPYQRSFGDCFNGYLRSDFSAGDWTELGALGQIAWDKSGQEALLEIPDYLSEQGIKSLRKMGLTSSDWFVAMHIRSTGFHKEGKRSLQTHRNAEVEDYLPAIKAITDRGGWVIRMGDPTMSPLPLMDKVIDYPHTEFKSEECDIFLAANARFFVGTTSGLTNAVISLGTPCLLVNCISNYFQLWNNRVLFTIKPLWSRIDNRYLTLSEMTAENLRWKIFNINRLDSLGIEPHPNTPEEIEAATIEMLERIVSSKVMSETEADTKLKLFCNSGGNDNFFGNGRLSYSFYLSRKTSLFQE